jgi:hypothetical protein
VGRRCAAPPPAAPGAASPWPRNLPPTILIAVPDA